MAVLGWDDALAVVRQHATETGPRATTGQTTEHVDLLSAQGRILARELTADRDQPPFDRATRDGFAVQADAWTRSGDTGLHLVGEIRAGQQWTGASLEPHQAIAIMTGAPVPPGANAVVMIEHTQHSSARIRAQPGRCLRSGDNIVPQAAEAHRGDTLLAPGTPIEPPQIALAASCGRATLEVYPRPTVAVVATGDELVDIAHTPEAWQIRNSNSTSLAALVTAAGAQPDRLPIARDLRDQIRDRIAQSRLANLLLLSGGVSMGSYDLVEDVLAEFGAEFFFTGVRMQPGKPVVFGRLPRREDSTGARPELFFFGLPGNPVSTEVTFHCFVRPLLRTLAGQGWTGPSFVQATLAESVNVAPGLTRLLPATLVPTREHPELHLVPWRGSGDLAANARANCYAVLPETADHVPAGSILTVLLR